MGQQISRSTDGTMQHPYEGQETKTNTLKEIKFNKKGIQLEKIALRTE